jgi:hypothetical protein
MDSTFKFEVGVNVQQMLTNQLIGWNDNHLNLLHYKKLFWNGSTNVPYHIFNEA